MKLFARDEFTAQRKGVLDRGEEKLLPVVEHALEQWSPKGQWWEPILPVAESVYTDIYRDESGADVPGNSFDDLKGMLAKALSFTEKPQKHTPEVVARFVTLAAVNGATAAAAHDDETDLDLEWVTMHDSHVRASHRAADGQTRKMGEPFHIGDAELDFPGDPNGPLDEIMGCRCVLRPTPSREHATIAQAGTYSPDGGRTWFTLTPVITSNGANMSAPVTYDEAPATITPPTQQVPWHGVMAVEGAKTGDGRSFSPNSLRNRDLPLPLTWQEVTDEGHSKSHVVGMIHGLKRQDNGDGTHSILGHGTFRQTPEADRAIGTVADFGKYGVSIDADDASYEYDDESQSVNFSDARICGACLVHIPAFAEAYIQLGEAPWATEGLDGPQGGDEPVDSTVAAGADTITLDRGPGWVTDPKDTARIHGYWTLPGKPGYEKIAWGTPGDFDRCRAEVGKYLTASGEPEFINQTCALWHNDALGYYPATHAKMERHGLSTAPAISLVASAGGDGWHPPAEWFTNPHLPCATPTTFVKHAEGIRVVGHIAEWGVCHAAFPGTCVTAPHSTIDYADFMLGGVECADGSVVRVGQITVGGGHADTNLGMRAALEHYDNVATAVVDIVVGEDEFGIWFSGALRPWATEQQKHELLAAKLSGDWREHGWGGPLELIAAHCVNSPGFKVGASVQDTRQISLVAAGALAPRSAGEDTSALEELMSVAVAKGIEQYRESEERTQRIRALGQEFKIDPAAIADRLLAEFGD